MGKLKINRIFQSISLTIINILWINDMKTPITQPPTIRYNLKDRGRQFRGQERNFNIKALCDSIMSGPTQERVKTRAMLGYFGHKPRILAGMEPMESLVINGKYNEIEPAIVTTSLTCDMAGNIEHKTEFLDTPSGRRAARMFANRIGGFSTVIDQGKNEFIGQDFVLDPNFSGNRGFSLDSADLTFDQVLCDAQSEEEDFWNALVNVKDNQIETLTVTLDHLQEENIELLSILASSGKNNDHQAPILPVSVSLDSVNRLERDRSSFHKEARLPGFVEIVNTDQQQSDDNYNNLLSQMGIAHV